MMAIQKKKRQLYRRAAKWRNELLVLTAQLAELIRANAPLPGGLLALASESPSATLRDILLSLRQDIVAGRSLSEAMERQPSFFPAYYVELVRNGERSGQLEQAFVQLEDGLVNLSALSDKLRNYMFYIASVFIIELFLAVQLCLFILPQLDAISASFGHRLPFLSRTLIEIFAHLKHWEAIPLLFLLLVTGVLLWRNLPFLSNRRTALQRFLGRVSLHVPVLRYIVSRRDLAHTTAVLQRLLAVGTPLDTAMATVAQLDVNIRYREALARITKRIEQGVALKTAMNAERHVFPESFLGMIALGESGGSLPEVLGRISALYHDEAIKTAHILLDIAAPAAVCVLGTFVFWIYSGIFSAVFFLPTLVK